MVDMLPALADTLAAADAPLTAEMPNISVNALNIPRRTLDLALRTCNRALISCAPLDVGRPRHSCPTWFSGPQPTPCPSPANHHIATVFINLLPACCCNLYWILVDPGIRGPGSRPRVARPAAAGVHDGMCSINWVSEAHAAATPV